jgi:hypothetical protein
MPVDRTLITSAVRASRPAVSYLIIETADLRELIMSAVSSPFFRRIGKEMHGTAGQGDRHVGTWEHRECNQFFRVKLRIISGRINFFPLPLSCSSLPWL